MDPSFSSQQHSVNAQAVAVAVSVAKPGATASHRNPAELHWPSWPSVTAPAAPRSQSGGGIAQNCAGPQHHILDLSPCNSASAAFTVSPSDGKVKQLSQGQLAARVMTTASSAQNHLDSMLDSWDTIDTMLDSNLDTLDLHSSRSCLSLPGTTSTLVASSVNGVHAALAERDKLLRTQAVNTVLPSTNSSSSLYVKNLSPDADELYLYHKFSPYGALISCKVKTDSVTGKCRGVGFVNFVEAQCAMKAMQQLHGTRTSEGRFLHVTLQPPRAVRAAAAAAATAANNIVLTGAQGSLMPRASNELQKTYTVTGHQMVREPIVLDGSYGYVVTSLPGGTTYAVPSSALGTFQLADGSSESAVILTHPSQMY